MIAIFPRKSKNLPEIISQVKQEILDTENEARDLILENIIDNINYLIEDEKIYEERLKSNLSVLLTIRYYPWYLNRMMIYVEQTAANIKNIIPLFQETLMNIPDDYESMPLDKLDEFSDSLDAVIDELDKRIEKMEDDIINITIFDIIVVKILIWFHALILSSKK